MSIGREPDQLVWLYSLATDAVSLPLHVLFDLEVDERLGANSALRFSVRRDDDKVPYLQADQRMRWNNQLYRNTQMLDVRKGNEVYVEVYAEALWYDLQKRVRPGNYAILGQTVEAGLDAILLNTGWARGTTPVDPLAYSIESNDATVIQLLRSWAAVTGYELVFDTVLQTVTMLAQQGDPVQVPFRYGRNLVDVERRYEPPVCTRLYAYGAASLNIAATNPTGLEYVENFDWYTDQGLTIIEARARHRKDQVWVDERFLSAVNLYDAAVSRVARLSQPVISYEVGVIDLSQQLGLDEGEYAIGDTVQVFDEELGLDLSTRIVRTTKYPRNRQDNKVELEYLRPGLADGELALDQRSINYGEIIILVDANTDPITLSNSLTIYSGITITVSGTTTPVMGSTLVGTATGSGTLDVYATVDGTQIGARIQVDFTDGEQVEVSWPTYVADLAEGTYVLDWRAIVTTGTGTVDVVAGAGRSWALVRGAVGVGFASSPNQVVAEEVQSVTTGTVSVAATALVEVVTHDVEAGATAVNPTLGTIQVEELLPFTLDNPVFGRLDGPAILAPPLADEWEDS